MTSCLLWRHDFPMLEKKIEGAPLIYFDTAATAQKPKSVIDSISDFYSNSYATVHRGAYVLSREATELYMNARVAVQHFLNAEYPEQIIFTRGATDSLNLLARSFAAHFIREGDAIILSEIEHHSNIVPWQMVCEERGAELRVIPVDDQGELIFEAFEELLDEKVKLVSLAHISNVLGTLHPIKKIIDAAHSKGAYVCLDGAQAAPHLPVDVQQLDVDFYIFSGHKLYGPTGIGVLYGKRELLEAMPPVYGGGDMIDLVSFEKTTYGPLPLKFEAGTPMIAEAIGLKAAVDYLLNIGMEAIRDSEQQLLDYALKALLRIPHLKIVGAAKERGALISFIVEGVHPLDLATLLDCRGVAVRTGHLCSQPAMQRFGLSSVTRISFGLYNTFEEIDRFLEILEDVVSYLR